jgi:penicillin-binding protein 1C
MRRVGRIALLGVAGAVVSAVLLIWWLPLPSELQRPVAGTLTLLDDQGREIAEIASPDARVQMPVKLNEMGEWLPRMTIALEDHRFYEHAGIDWRSTAAACMRNLQIGRVVSGGSTITQQLVKLACHRRRRSWLGKLYEAILALKLERRWSKDHILAEYLNRCSFGNRRLGPEAAARAYFGKPARDLTLPEAIFLSGLPQAPSRLNPWRYPDLAQRKFARSAERLAQLGVITQAQRRWLAQSPVVARRFDPPRLAPHFVDAIRSQHPGLRGKVRTTLDLDLQGRAERMLRVHLDALNRGDITEAALVILDNATGAVRAMVGSAHYEMSQINGAIRSRSCGSTLKPFVYLEAIDRRILTAASLLPDTPDAIRGEYSDYDPQNFNHHYLGPVRVREALACSLNVPAIVALSRVGARSSFYKLRKWGFNFPENLDEYGAGFILGNAEIRLIDLAAAYAGLARGGLAMPAKLVASEYYPITRIVSVEATDIITDILCDNQARGKSFGTNSPLAFEERVAAKTGTSSGFRDAWTVGFDKEHTVAVWAGNFDGRPMRDTLSVRSAAPLWSTVMHDLLKNDHPVNPPSAHLARCQICVATGLLPSPFSAAKMSELFLAGTEPTKDSASWFSAEGKLLLPGEYAGWCSGRDNTLGAAVVPEPRIVNPLPNSTFEIDPELPRTQQMVELTATIGDDVHWSVNGVPVLPQRDGRFFWQLTPGEWELQAIGRNGAAAREKITVD